MDDVTLTILCFVGLAFLPFFLYGISIWFQLLKTVWQKFSLLFYKIIIKLKHKYESYIRIRSSRRGRRASDRV